MEEIETDQYPQKLSKQAQRRQPRNYNQGLGMNLPWWRSPFFGYLICPLLIGMASLADIGLQRWGLKLYTASAPFYLTNVLIAWLWGVGPALSAIVLGYFALDTFVIPPFGVFTFNDWSDIVIFLPFIITQLLVVLITSQREKAQQRVLAAEQRVERHAQELTETNQALSQSIHRLEQLASHLEEANQLKDYFLSRVSHELKTPITTIRGQTQLVLRHLSRSSQMASEQLSLPTHLQKIESQTRRMHVLVDDLLDLSSLNSGKISLRLAQCNLGSLCSEVIEDQRTLSYRFAFRGTNSIWAVSPCYTSLEICLSERELVSDRCIELELPSEPVILQADRQRLTQVIINLVTNAIKYSLGKIVVRICLIQEPSHAILTVHNDGPAIPQEQQIRIFEPFYRAPEAEHSSIQGSGLGLSISKEIVERHEGQIWVESSEGKGTTFCVQLPLSIG